MDGQPAGYAPASPPPPPGLEGQGGSDGEWVSEWVAIGHTEGP